MDTISTVEEGTFKKSDISLVDQVFEYFRSYNFELERKYGMISIKKSGIKSSISHGMGIQKYFESCVVKESTTKNAFYLHEVGIIKEGEMPFKTEPMFSGKTPSVRNILHSLINVKSNIKIKTQTAQEAVTKSGSLITSASVSVNSIYSSLKNVKSDTDNVGAFGRN